MVIVMDMSTGKVERLDAAEAAAEEFGPFEDEVLNAGWLPQPEARLETHPHLEQHEKRPAVAAADADAFLRALYRNQE
jgi:hypothetical protein